MGKKVVVASNMLNEISQLITVMDNPIGSWFDNMIQIADGGMLIVDGGSTDGTQEFFEKKIKEGYPVVVVVDNVIQISGYGAARTHLRDQARKHFSNVEWVVFFDADERLNPEEFHHFRWMKDYLIPTFDVVAFPRIDWMDDQKTRAAKDWKINPDFQARMTRLNSPLRYVRRVHEQVMDYEMMYANSNTPKINHFHRSTDQDKRDRIGRLCAKLHREDDVYGKTYPKHHKEDFYYEQFKRWGL